METDWDGRNVNGLHKAGGCFYVQTSTPYYSDCRYIADSIDGCTFAPTSARAWTNLSHMVWLRREDGTIDFNDGGRESQPDA